MISRLTVQTSDCGDLPGDTTMESVSYLDLNLYHCSIIGDIEGVIAALAKGGRVSMRIPMVGSPEGATPLLVAALGGHTEICGLLLAHGSNVNEMMPDTKNTALHFAAGNGNNTLVEALLSRGAELNPQEHSGFTPLHIACQEGHLLCVLTLLEAGASLTLPNIEGALPIHLAAKGNRVEVVKTLLEHGCNVDMVSWKSIEQKNIIFIPFSSAAAAGEAGHH